MRTPGYTEVDQLQGAALPESEATPISILVVDDEPKNLTVLETILDDPQYRVIRAESADQALLALLAREFALIVLDIRMPGTSGLELAKMIKERRKSAFIPIIFLTAYYNEDEHVLEGYGSGAVDYLYKPVNSTVLRSKVAVFADLHRKQRESEWANRVLAGEVASRRRAEDQLRELNATLEEQVSARTKDIEILLNEVNHRSKNILSLVLAIAKQTAASGSGEFVQRFSRRIQALSTHQDLMLKSQWRNVDCETLIKAQLAHFEDIVGERIVINGPAVRVAARAVQSIGMAVHELATNAVKHGALSNQKGRVDIGWELLGNRGNEQFILSWKERGGPQVEAPERRGFGSKVIKNMIELSLDGNVTLDYAPAGFNWHLACPAANIWDHRLESELGDNRRTGR
jgi:two-component sensor histidine kinase/CheY-like chemotaxis protein